MKKIFIICISFFFFINYGLAIDLDLKEFKTDLELNKNIDDNGNNRVIEGFNNNFNYEITKVNNYNTINGRENFKGSVVNAFLYGGKVFFNDLDSIYQTNIDIGLYSVIKQGSLKIFNGYIRNHGQGKTFYTDFSNKKAVELTGLINSKIATEKGIVKNAITYYSKATNSIRIGGLYDGNTSNNGIKDDYKLDHKFITLPGSDCSNASKSDGIDCPKINKFSYFGGINSYGKLQDTNGVFFPYKKYNFSFSPKNIYYELTKDAIKWKITYDIKCGIKSPDNVIYCNTYKELADLIHNYNKKANNIVFSYIANQDSLSNKYKVKTYNNGKYYDIIHSLNPVYSQMIDDNNIIVVYDNLNDSYKIEKYNFLNNKWNQVNEYTKDIEGINDVTDFYYDNNNQILYFSSFGKNDNNKIEGYIYSVAFDHFSNIPFKQVIYNLQLTEKIFSNNYENFSTSKSESYFIPKSNSLNSVDTFISSINFDLNNQQIYINGFSHNGKYANQFIEKVKFSTNTILTGEAMTYSSGSTNTNPQISTMNMGYNGDGIERKYASTRMTGCDENDIILGDKVWASCNSNYELPNTRYYSATNSTSKDINGWNYGKLYHTESVLCPSGYNVPSETDFKNLLLNRNNISILKLPASGAYAYNKYQNKDLKGYYWITGNDSKFAWFKIEPYETNIGGFGNDLAFLPIRCIRSTPVTFEEKNGDLEVVDNGLTMTGGLYQTSFGSGYNNSYGFLKQTEDLTSKDEYVNEKLKEINDCFLSNYSAHLENINASIEKLKKERDNQKDEKSKKKYDSAIKKLEEIKVLFTKRYKNVIELDGGN